MGSREDDRPGRWLHRGRLRDVVIVLCVASTLLLPTDMAMVCVGTAMLMFGCVLHVLVKGQLVRNVKLCTEGMYAIVRHPYYLANYLIDTSFCLLSGNYFLLVLYPFLFFWAYGETFREEESRLASMHGDDFEEFRARVPQVFPNRVSLAGLRTVAKDFSWRRVSRGEIKRVLRFGFVGSLLVLLQRVGLDGAREIVDGRNPLGSVEQSLAAVCAILLVASAVIPRRREDAEPGG